LLAGQGESGAAVALAVHPALLSEAAAQSFRVCRAYLSLLLGAARRGNSLQAALAGLLHLLRLGGRPAQLTEAALRRLAS
jgi:hypothetical protein